MAGPNVAGLTFTKYDRDGARALTDQLAGLYRGVYAEPPYFEGPDEAAEFIRRLAGQSEQPGFSLVASWREHELVGYVFGFTLTARSTVSDTILISGGPLLPSDRPAGVVYVSELLVQSGWRRRGIGRALLSCFLTHRDESCATLLAHPDAAPAQAVYASLGWRKVGWGSPFPNSPLYETFVLDL
jgi:GNAT superfamily N-acetyltransferase